MARFFLAIGFTVLVAAMAHAGAFQIPDGDAPAISIEVPDTWHPNLSDDTIDATSPDRTVFLWLTVEKAADAAAVKAKAMKSLTRNGMKIDPASIKEGAVAFAGLDSTDTQYVATENGQPRLVRIRASRLDAKRFIQLVQWGPSAAFDKNATSLGNILASVKVVGK